MPARRLIIGKASLEGWRCRQCDSFVVPLASVVKLTHPSRPKPEKAHPVVQQPQTVSRIDERDRVFSFLLGVPLELTDRIERRPPATSALISVCVVLFVVDALSNGSLSSAWSLSTIQISAGTVWQLLSSVFIHWDVLHILGNLYFLYAFGRLPESRLGAGRMVGLFFITGLVGNVVFLMLNLGEDTYLAGASGAVSGILGYYFARFPTHRVGLSLFFTVLRVPALLYLGVWFLFQTLYATVRDDQVAHSAHVAGFIAGAVLAWLSQSRKEVSRG